jgi:putative transcriptional regulator
LVLPVACAAGPAGVYFFMREMGGNGAESLAGSLLIAHPNMLDPNFRRTVLFISAHDPDDGALGVILNRPLDKHVSDIVTDEAPAGLGDVPVFLGGPVGRNQLMFAAFEWQKGEGLRLNHNVEIENVGARLEEDPNSVCAFVGYAGWSAGQLEAEMKQNAWLLQKPTRARLQPEKLPRLWFDIMRDLGPWFKMLSAAPDDPSLN